MDEHMDKINEETVSEIEDLFERIILQPVREISEEQNKTQRTYIEDNISPEIEKIQSIKNGITDLKSSTDNIKKYLEFESDDFDFEEECILYPIKKMVEKETESVKSHTLQQAKQIDTNAKEKVEMLQKSIEELKKLWMYLAVAVGGNLLLIIVLIVMTLQ